MQCHFNGYCHSNTTLSGSSSWKINIHSILIQQSLCPRTSLFSEQTQINLNLVTQRSPFFYLWLNRLYILARFFPPRLPDIFLIPFSWNEFPFEKSETWKTAESIPLFVLGPFLSGLNWFYAGNITSSPLFFHLYRRKSNLYVVSRALSNYKILPKGELLRWNQQRLSFQTNF